LLFKDKIIAIIYELLFQVSRTNRPDLHTNHIILGIKFSILESHFPSFVNRSLFESLTNRIIALSYLTLII